MRPCEGCPSVCEGCEVAQRRNAASAAGLDRSIWMGASPDKELSLEESHRAGVPHPGLPAPLPQGEHVVWQGAPRWYSLARQQFHTHLIAAYFAIFALWQAAAAHQDGHAAAEVVFAAGLALVAGAAVIGLLGLLAWLSARAAIYTITNRRIVMRIGVALINTMDIPFKAINGLQVKTAANGVGNISIGTKRGARIPYFVLWPHARPWHLRHPEPMLRALPDVTEVASLLTAQIEADERSAELASEDLPVAAPARPEPEPSQAPAPVQPRETRPLLFGAAALVLLTLFSVGWIQLSEPVKERFAGQTPRMVHELSFRDLGGDRLAVVDADSGETFGLIEPGGDGLIRGALRGLNRARIRRGLPTDRPYQLVIWDSDRVTLSDLETDRHVPLDAFGPNADGVLSTLVGLRDAVPAEGGEVILTAAEQAE